MIYNYTHFADECNEEVRLPAQASLPSTSMVQTECEAGANACVPAAVLQCLLRPPRPERGGNGVKKNTLRFARERLHIHSRIQSL